MWLLACSLKSAPVAHVVESPRAAVEADQPVVLVLEVRDRDTPPDQLTVRVVGDLPATGSPRVDRHGRLALTVVPTAGDHWLEIVVTDPDGLQDAASIDLVAVDADADGDGYRSTALGGADCADDDPTRHPGAPEVCDGLDQDCDGLVDEYAIDMQSWYPDLDGDSFGDPAGGVLACQAPDGMVPESGDCNDHNRLFRARQTVVGEPSCDAFGDAFEWLGENAGDRAGDVLHDAGDLDGDGLSEVAISAVDYGGAAGAVYVVRNSAPGAGALSDAMAKLVGQSPGDSAGYDLTTLPDGDGHAELLVGAPGVDGPGMNAGAVYLVSGPVGGTTVLTDVARATIHGAGDGDGLGGVANAGDVDGDSVPDLVVGAVGSNLGGLRSGYVAVVSGTVTGDWALGDIATSWFVGEPGVEAGDPAEVGDLDGDGLADLVVGAQEDATNGAQAGAMYLVRSPLPTGVVSLADADGKWLGTAGSITSHSSDGVGDLDGDGLGDVAIGAPYDSPNGNKSGTTYIVAGPGPLGGGVQLRVASVAMIQGDRPGIRAGFSVSRAYDIDGDGALDVAIGAKYDDTAGLEAGAVFLVSGPLAGTSSVADARFKLLGRASGDLFGDVGAAPDVDGDGRSELLVGARFHRSGGAELGAAYVVFGTPL